MELRRHNRTTHKKKKMSMTDPTKIRVLAKGKRFLLLV